MHLLFLTSCCVVVLYSTLCFDVYPMRMRVGRLTLCGNLVRENSCFVVCVCEYQLSVQNSYCLGICGVLKRKKTMAEALEILYFDLRTVHDHFDRSLVEDDDVDIRAYLDAYIELYK